MPLLSIKREDPPIVRLAPPPDRPQYPFQLSSTNVNMGHVPGRGLIYSILLHSVILAGLFSPAFPRTNFSNMPPKQWELTMIPKDKIYLPILGGGSEGDRPKGLPDQKQATTAPAAAIRRARIGYSYQGPQEIVSNPPDPTNHIQTILQPGIKKLPEMLAFMPLPNLVQTMATPQPPSVTTPAPPAPKSVEPPRPPAIMAEPNVPNIPLVPAPPLEAPHLELPKAVAANMADSMSQLPPAPTPPEPKPIVPKLATLPRTPTNSTRDLLLTSAMPAPPTANLQVPKAEAHGQFVIVPAQTAQSPATPPGSPGVPDVRSETAALGASSSPLASGYDAAGEKNAKLKGGTYGDEQVADVTEGHGLGPGKGLGRGVGPGIGKGPGVSAGSGVGAGAGPGASPFPDMTIQGGEGPSAAVSLPSQQQSGDMLKGGSYNLTIVSTGNSGGGLGDFGVFRDEAVFTVYLNLSSSANDSQSNWVFQYAVVNPGGVRLDNLVAPFPITKVKPEWPTDLMTKYRGQTLVAFAVIDDEGKIRRLKMMQSPNMGFDVALAKALDAWVFRPARANDRPIAVKGLFGIPISPTQ
jgi:hypothetical protein